MASLNEKDREWFSGKIQSAITSLETSEWINKQIAEAVEAFRTKGWRKAADNIVAFGSPVAICALIVALLSIAAAAFYQATNRTKEEAEFRKGTSDELRQIHTEVVGARALISASQPQKKQNQDAAKELLAQSTQKLIPSIPESAVRQAGESFIGASLNDPGAWDVSVKFANYRTTINEAATRDFRPSNITVSRTFKFCFTAPGGGIPDPTVEVSRVRVLQRSAAVLEPLSGPCLPPSDMGPDFIALRGGGVILDGSRMRNIVFFGDTVYYNGGPVDLNSVVFSNSQFILANNENARAFAERVLSMDKVSFVATSSTHN